MNANFIPSVLPIAKKIIQLEKFKEELKKFDNSEDCGRMIKRYRDRLKENISKLEEELKRNE